MERKQWNVTSLDTTMGEKTLIARRAIKDYVRHIGSIENFEIGDNLFKLCGLAGRWYKAYLEEKKVVQKRKLLG